MIKMYILCSGLDAVRRGFEAYSRDLFNLLTEESDIDITLLKGTGSLEDSEYPVPNIHRTRKLNQLLSKLTGKHPFTIERISFSLGLVPYLVMGKPDLVFSPDMDIFEMVHKLRGALGLDFSLVCHTGGGLHKFKFLDAGDISRRDHVHHPTPVFREAATRSGFKEENQFTIPCFLDLPEDRIKYSPANVDALKSEFALPLSVPIILSVGQLDRSVKRMNYVIEEVANSSKDCFLLMAGETCEETKSIRKLARNRLGEDRFLMTSVPRERMMDLYQIADLFVLASKSEGFGLVYLEALANGLPVVAHDFEVSRYVLGPLGFREDLERSGELRSFIEEHDFGSDDEVLKDKRFEYVKDRFSASSVVSSYAKQFRQIGNQSS